MKPKLDYARVSDIYARGKASDYIRRFDTLKPGDKVFLFCRKSRCDRNDSLADQEANLRKVATEHGLIVVGVRSYVGSGNDLWRLASIVDEAEELGAVALLAECTNRFRRNEDFRSNVKWRAKFQATETELKDLQWWTRGFPLVTHCAPDATADREKEHQTRRRAEHKRGGRPPQPGYKKRVRQRYRRKAIRMRREGASLGQIAKALKVPRSTIQDWTRGTV